MKSPLPAAALLLLLAGTMSRAQETATAPSPESRYAAAAAAIDADLQTELARLAQLRERIAAGRPALAREAGAIATEVRGKRRQADLARQTNESLEAELSRMDREIRAWRDEQAYIHSLLQDFRTQSAARLSLAEREDLALPPSSGTLEGLLDLTSRAAASLSSELGGRVLPGEVIGPDGAVRQGRFVLAGPVEWFVAGDGDLAGLVVARPGLQAEVAPNTGDVQTLTALAAGESATPFLDPTLGTALAIQSANPGWIAHLRAGGVWMIPILLLGLVATAASFLKWWQILAIRDLAPGLPAELLATLQTGGAAAARQKLEGLRHPARALLERGIETAGHPREFVEEAMYEKFAAAQPVLQRGLPFIAIASATAPLLGLLGTVTGMIHTFQLIHIFGTGDARSLASGISEALITTEYGLIVAIPALLLHAFLSRKVKGILASMEVASLAFLNGLKPNPAP